MLIFYLAYIYLRFSRLSTDILAENVQNMLIVWIIDEAFAIHIFANTLTVRGPEFRKHSL